jgi:Nif-specific regulatory protein
MSASLGSAFPEPSRFQVVFISGPFTGTRRDLPEGSTSIGREPGNDIELPDVTVSRRHCLLQVSGDRVHLTDLGSVNGTIVNGRPVQGEIRLEPGDQVDLGATRMVLQTDDACPAASETEDLLLRSTVFLGQEDELYNARTAAASAERTARDLQSLLALINTLGEADAMPQLMRALANAALEALPGDRVAILPVEDPGMRSGARVATAWRRGFTEPVRCTLHASLVDRVLRDRTAVLSNDVITEYKALNPSTNGEKILALLAAPLLALRHQVGILYVDASENARGGSSATFDELHLQWSLAAGRIAGLAIENLRRRDELASENRQLRQGNRLQWQAIGDSPRMQELYRTLSRVAATESTVLLTGESGTGKELAARAIHAGSPRADNPFVAVNCAVLSESLLESDLFGHEKGSFTSAVSQKKGKFEVADGGTLFLDELGELALPLQAKLLRALQEKAIERVGGTRPIPVNVRLVAATNRDLGKMVAEGRFRADLYYRLNVVRVHLPPLRERIEDVPLLAAYFAEKCAVRARRRVRGISEAAMAVLRAHDWPGNVRELENAIERAVVLGQDEFIQPEDLPQELLEQPPAVLPAEGASVGPASPYQDMVREAKRQSVLRAFEAVSYSHQEAARLLNIHPNNLHRLIRRLGLKDVLRGRAAEFETGSE